MKNASLRLAVVLLLLTGSGVLAPRSRARQATGAAEKERKLGAIVYEGDMAGLLGKLGEEFGVTIGLETDPAEPRPRVKINLREATFRDVMDAVVQSQPSYHWRQDGGFVDVLPSKGGSPLLDTPVTNFQVNATSWAAASDALLKLPEVQTGVSALGLNRKASEGYAAGPSGQSFSVYVENAPVRRALHEITKRSGGHFWVFRQQGEGGKTFTLDATGAPRG